MTRLAKLQRQFADAAFGDRAAIHAAGAGVRAENGWDGAALVDIYRRSINGALTTALNEIFPVVTRLVGDEFFAAMAARFVRNHASRSPDLADYGGGLPAFIRDFPPAAALPYLADVALLEWCWHRAFHAADQAPLDAQALQRAAAGDASDIVFALPVSASLVSSPYPISQIWTANQPDEPGDAELNLDGCDGDKLIVWRAGRNELRMDPLDDADWELLDEVRNGATLEALSDIDDLDSRLPRCAARGWLANFSLADSRHAKTTGE